MFRKYFLYALLATLSFIFVSCGDSGNNGNNGNTDKGLIKTDDANDGVKTDNNNNVNKGFLEKYQYTIMSQKDINEYVKDDGSYVKINGKKVNFQFILPEEADLPEPDDTQFQGFLSITQENHSATAIKFKALLKENKYDLTYINIVNEELVGTHQGVVNGESAFVDFDNQQLLLQLANSELKSIDGSRKSVFIDFSLSEKVVNVGSASVVVNPNNDKEILITDGDLGKKTYRELEKLLNANPNIKTILLGQVNGSVDDKINVETGRMIRKRGLNTKVLKDSHIASGGVDLFTSGVERIYAKGAKIGVHSWEGDGRTGDSFPKDDKAHHSQLGYFTAMLPVTGYDFYFYTLSSAPANDIYYMKESELNKYKIITKTIE